MHIIEVTELHALFENLISRGYALIGPTVRSGAIVYDSIGSVDDLPRGWGDEQEPAYYRLNRSLQIEHFSLFSSSGVFPCLMIVRNPNIATKRIPARNRRASIDSVIWSVEVFNCCGVKPVNKYT